MDISVLAMGSSISYVLACVVSFHLKVCKELKRCRQAKHDSYSRDEGSVTVSKFSFNEYIF